MPYNAHNMPGPGDEETWGPCTNHPMDPRTPSDDGDDEAAFEKYSENLQDLEGYLVESFSEAPNEMLQKLADTLPKVTCEDGTPYVGNPKSNAELVELVVGMTLKYCWPED